MWATLISMLIPVLKDAPEIIDMFANMRASGRTEPNDDDKKLLTDALAARGIEDAIWDNFGS